MFTKRPQPAPAAGSTLTRLDAGQAAAAGEPRDPQPARTAQFTHGARLGATVMGALLGVAIACGPAALLAEGYGIFTAAPAKPIAAAVAPGFTTAQQDAGAYALSYVTAWLGATSADSSALSQFTSTSSLTFPQTAAQYRDAQVATISPAVQGTVQVVVGAAVQPASGDAAVWPRRYYAVSVDIAQHPRPQAIGLPAPTAGPATSKTAPDLAYSNTVAANTGVGQAVSSFLSAYLAGQGDITVVLTPGTSIQPIRPVPYRAVQVEAISASAAPPDNPADGTVLQVQAQAQLTIAADNQQPATFLIRLRSRAGRWEVDGLDAHPSFAPNR